MHGTTKTKKPAMIDREKWTTTWSQVRFFGRTARALRAALPNGRVSSSHLVAERARSRPEDLAIAFEDQRYSWREVDEETNRWANFFASLGIVKGNTVALLLDNRPEYIFALSGLNRLRAVAALINTNIAGKGLAHALRISNSCACVVGTEHAAKLEEVLPNCDGLVPTAVFEQSDGSGATCRFSSADEGVSKHTTNTPPGLGDPKKDEAMCFIFTSGTTGLPKAAVIKNSRWFLAATGMGRGVLEATSHDLIYVTLPLYHSNAMFVGWGAALTTGAGMALRRKFSASRFWDDVRSFEATAFIYIGELLRYLLNQEERPTDQDHQVRVIAGNGLRPDIWERFATRFGIPKIREFYGATEGNAPCVNLENRPGMVGRLGPGQKIIQCDLATGEVMRSSNGFCTPVAEGQTGLLIGRISAVTPFDGYADKAATDKKILRDVFRKEDRYFNSGDLITLHANSWMAFADRVGDTFRWKGENVSTNEVAEVLNEAPGVLESNVYGVQVPGADGRAGMASLHCDESFSLTDFTRFVLAKLPIYQRPYFLRLQKDMRITGTFKHQKVNYRKEGFDPSSTTDPLLFLDGDVYETIDEALFTDLQSGAKAIR